MDTSRSSSTMMSDAQASLTVTSAAHPSLLASGLVALWEAGELCDYVISGTGESFAIHSPVLAAQSPVFKTMLTSDMKESAKREAACTFPEIADGILKKILEVAYTGTCSISSGELGSLLAAAHYLGMSSLLQACEKLIPTVLCPSNCFLWTRVAKTFEIDGPVPHIRTLMRTAHEEVVRSDEFAEAEGAEVAEYIRDLARNGRNSDVALSAALQWIQYDPESRAEHMQELFHCAFVQHCTKSFLEQVMRENSDIIELQQDMHNLILEDIKAKDSASNLLILGGQDCDVSDTANNDCWILQDERLVKFTAAEKLKPYHSICQVPQGIMFTGGRDSMLCKLFAVAIKTWITKAPLLNQRMLHGSGYLHGKVYVVAGQKLPLSVPLNSVDYMDLATESWQPGPDLPVQTANPRVGVCNSRLHVLFSTGEQAGKLYCLECVNTSMTWTEKSRLPTHKASWFSMAAAHDRMFVAGGDQNINYMYTPATDSWCRLTGPSLMNDCDGSLVYHREKLYLIAGCAANRALTAVVEYDIGSDKWVRSSWKLPTPLYGHAAFVMNVRL